MEDQVQSEKLGGQGGTSADPKKAPRSRFAVALPSDRQTASKFFEAVRAAVIASTPAGKAVSNDDIGLVLGASAYTVGLSTSFWSDTPVLRKQEKGFLPSDAARNYVRMIDFGADNPAHEIGPALMETWFSEALLPKLRMRELPENEALIILSREGGIEPGQRKRLETLLDIMRLAGLIMIDGGNIKVGPAVLKMSGQGPQTPTHPATRQEAPAVSNPALVGSQLGTHSPVSDIPALGDDNIRGLIRRLPKPGDAWSRSDRARWKAALEATLDLVYGPAEDATSESQPS